MRRKKAVENLVETVENSTAAQAVRKAFEKAGIAVGAVTGVILCYEVPMPTHGDATCAHVYHYGKTPEFMDKAIDCQKFAPSEGDPGFMREHRDYERYWVEANG